MGEPPLASFYLVPDSIEADLVGGPHSGKAIWLPPEYDVPYQRFMLPVWEERTIADYLSADPPAFSPLRIAVYERTGIRDNGHRIFTFRASASNL